MATGWSTITRCHQRPSRVAIEAIALGMAEGKAMGDPGMSAAAEAALSKVVASLPDTREQQLLHVVSRVFRPHRRMQVPPFLEIMREACWHEHALDIAYTDQAGTVSERTIWPLAIVYTDQSLTAPAWCCLRQDFRLFRLDRLQRVDKTGHSFRPRRVPMLRTYVAQLNARTQR
ncbi:helix-turn-helix transcriptional regulator [Bradyrhizobium sp. Lot33]